MPGYQPITLSPHLNRMLGPGAGGGLPIADRHGRGRRRRRSSKINTFKLRVMGSTELVDRHGRHILSVLAQPRRTALLAYLAIATEDGMEDRSRLASMFWPRSNADQGAARLDRAMYSLRRSLTRSSICNDGNGRVGVCRQRVRTDVDELEKAVHRKDARAVAKLYRGRLLEGVDLPGLTDFNSWLEGERARLDDAVASLTRAPTLVLVDGSDGPPQAPGTTDPEPLRVGERRSSGDEAHRRRRFLDLILRVG